MGEESSWHFRQNLLNYGSVSPAPPNSQSIECGYSSWAWLFITMIHRLITGVTLSGKEENSPILRLRPRTQNAGSDANHRNIEKLHRSEYQRPHRRSVNMLLEGEVSKQFLRGMLLLPRCPRLYRYEDWLNEYNCFITLYTRFWTLIQISIQWSLSNNDIFGFGT